MAMLSNQRMFRQKLIRSHNAKPYSLHIFSTWSAPSTKQNNTHMHTQLFFLLFHAFKLKTTSGWWFQPPWKNISQLGWLFPIYGNIKFMFQTTNQTYTKLWQHANFPGMKWHEMTASPVQVKKTSWDHPSPKGVLWSFAGSQISHFRVNYIEYITNYIWYKPYNDH